MRLGFTGTREGMSKAQIDWVTKVFEDNEIAVFEHGACVGADEQAHQIALANSNCHIIVRPPIKADYRSALCCIPSDRVTVMAPAPYLNRDRDIVSDTDSLIATPKQYKEPTPPDGGGTWYTVRYALRVNRVATVCYPDGRVEQPKFRIE